MNGTILHIYKNKGDIKGRTNYRPICLTQLIHKIWPNLITRILSMIMHLLTNHNHYGYRQGLSTIDGIIKLEQYIME